MISFLKKFGRKSIKKSNICTMVVVAAGQATRMEGVDKILTMLNGDPVLVYCLRLFEKSERIHEVIIVTRKDLMVDLGKMCREFQLEKVSKIIVGGETRSESVLAGLQEVREDASLIGIHDGARPFLSENVLNEVLDAGLRTGAAVPAVSVTDTVKQGKDGLITKTLRRETLFSVQTPQVFEASLIQAAVQQAVEEKITLTDDSSAVERLGMKVTLTKGEYRNIKITTPLDLNIAEGILKQEEFS